MTPVAPVESTFAYESSGRRIFAVSGCSLDCRSLKIKIDAVLNDPRFSELHDEPGSSIHSLTFRGVSKVFRFYIQTHLMNMSLRNKYIYSTELPCTDQTPDPIINRTPSTSSGPKSTSVKGRGEDASENVSNTRRMAEKDFDGEVTFNLPGGVGTFSQPKSFEDIMLLQSEDLGRASPWFDNDFFPYL